MSSTFYCVIASLESETTSVSVLSTPRVWFVLAVCVLIFVYIMFLGTFSMSGEEDSEKKERRDPSKTIKSELRFAVFAVPSVIAIVLLLKLDFIARLPYWFLLLVAIVVLFALSIKTFRDKRGDLSVKEQFKNYFGDLGAIGWIGLVVAPIMIASALALYGASFYHPNFPVVKPTCSDCGVQESDLSYVLSSVAGEDLDIPTYNIRPGYSRTVIDFSECQFADQQKKSSGSTKNKRVYWHTDRQYTSISGKTANGEYRSFTITGKTERHGMRVRGGTFYECTIRFSDNS